MPFTKTGGSAIQESHQKLIEESVTPLLVGSLWWFRKRRLERVHVALSARIGEALAEQKSCTDFYFFAVQFCSSLSFKVFPCRYEFANTYLFLDKMVYIFLQFVNVRVSMNITKSGLRRFFT